MTAKELLDAGRLREAIQAITAEVKARPSDTRARVFLFELLCLDGDLDRAAKQLDVIATLGAGVEGEMAVQIYKNLIAAERGRRAVFEDGSLPKFLLPPPAYADAFVVIVKQLRQAPSDAVARLAEAEEQSPALSGRLGDRAFSSFRDADDRLGPMLEVLHGADYLWLPFEQIRRLQITPPRNLRDTVWAPATIEMHDGEVGEVFVPALYVDTRSHADDQVRLGRRTEWRAVDDQLVSGAGRRLFLVDGEEVSLFDLGEIRFDRSTEERP